MHKKYGSKNSSVDSTKDTTTPPWWQLFIMMVALGVVIYLLAEPAYFVLSFPLAFSGPDDMDKAYFIIHILSTIQKALRYGGIALASIGVIGLIISAIRIPFTPKP